MMRQILMTRAGTVIKFEFLVFTYRGWLLSATFSVNCRLMVRFGANAFLHCLEALFDPVLPSCIGVTPRCVGKIAEDSYGLGGLDAGKGACPLQDGSVELLCLSLAECSRRTLLNQRISARMYDTFSFLFESCLQPIIIAASGQIQ